MFLGQAKLVGETADRVQITFNETTGKLDTRQLYRAEDVVAPDGKKVRQITLDARDKNQIPTIIARERKRHGLSPLSEIDLAAAAANYTTRSVNNPVVQRSINVSFAYLRHAMIKIGYELAFLWLGESYLADPVAVELRTAICDPDIASTDSMVGYVGDAAGCDLFKFWVADESHHLAYGSVLPGMGITVCVRVFDLYAAGIVVSRDPGRYLTNGADQAKLRFFAIDAVNGHTIDTPFAEESRRLATAMTAYGRPPPFPDPLTPVAD